MKRILTAALFLAILAGMAVDSQAAAQARRREVRKEEKKEAVKEEKKENIKDDQFFPELQNDEDMRVMQSDRNMVSSGVQYGGWISPVFTYGDDQNNRLAMLSTTLRVWFKTYLWNDSYLYVRAKDTYSAVMYHKGSAKAKNKNVLDLDLGYITMASKTGNVDFTVGRKYFFFGSGLIMNNRGDGAELNFYSPYINFKVLGSWTGWLMKDDNPYGLSDRDLSTGAKRVFAGGMVSTDWFNQTLYLFGIAQFDFGMEVYNRSRQSTAYLANHIGAFKYYSQRSRYNSQYYGVGLQGVITSGLTYSGEFTMERGKSNIADAYVSIGSSSFVYNAQKDILAYAVVGKLSYSINVILHPVLMAEYAFGSGDSNRADYRLPYSNTWGKDRGFTYFGTYMGGYSLKPLLANLHVLSASIAFSPFSWVDIYSIKNMTFIVRYLYYLKNRNLSPIKYGTDATGTSRRVGQGIDLSFRWLIFSDFSLFVNYGLFMPGSSYGYDFSALKYLYTGSFGDSYTHSYTAYKQFVMGGITISF